MTGIVETDPTGPPSGEEAMLRAAFGQAARELGPSSGMFTSVLARRRRQHVRRGVGGVVFAVVAATLATTLALAGHPLAGTGDQVTVVPANVLPRTVAGIELTWLPDGADVVRATPWPVGDPPDEGVQIIVAGARNDPHYEVTVVWGVNPDFDRAPSIDGYPVPTGGTGWEPGQPDVRPLPAGYQAARLPEGYYEPAEVAGRPAVAALTTKFSSISWATDTGFAVVRSFPPDAETTSLIANGVVVGDEPGQPSDPARAEADVRSTVANVFDFDRPAGDVVAGLADGDELADSVERFQRHVSGIGSRTSVSIVTVQFLSATEAYATGHFVDPTPGYVDEWGSVVALNLTLTPWGWAVTRNSYCEAVRNLFVCPP